MAASALPNYKKGRSRLLEDGLPIMHAAFRQFLLFLAPAHLIAWAEDGVEFFEKKIRPVLSEHCYECHGPKKQKAGLRLDTPAGVLRGATPLFDFPAFLPS